MPHSPDNEVAEEIALLAAIGNGDRTAFRQLYARYSAALFSLALRFVGDHGAAEEVLQDACVKLWLHAAHYDERKSRPFTWAVTLLRRTAIDYLRKKGRQPNLGPLPEDGTCLSELSTDENIHQTTEAHEAAECLRGALALLDAPQREALELALFSTLTHAEIATRLTQPPGSVKTWIRRGLFELRATLHTFAR